MHPETVVSDGVHEAQVLLALAKAVPVGPLFSQGGRSELELRRLESELQHTLGHGVLVRDGEELVARHLRDAHHLGLHHFAHLVGRERVPARLGRVQHFRDVHTSVEVVPHCDVHLEVEDLGDLASDELARAELAEVECLLVVELRTGRRSGRGLHSGVGEEHPGDNGGGGVVEHRVHPDGDAHADLVSRERLRGLGRVVVGDGEEAEAAAAIEGHDDVLRLYELDDTLQGRLLSLLLRLLRLLRCREGLDTRKQLRQVLSSVPLALFGRLALLAARHHQLGPEGEVHDASGEIDIQHLAGHLVVHLGSHSLGLVHDREAHGSVSVAELHQCTVVLLALDHAAHREAHLAAGPLGDVGLLHAVDLLLLDEEVLQPRQLTASLAERLLEAQSNPLLLLLHVQNVRAHCLADLNEVCHVRDVTVCHVLLLDQAGQLAKEAHERSIGGDALHVSCDYSANLEAAEVVGKCLQGSGGSNGLLLGELERVELVILVQDRQAVHGVAHGQGVFHERAVRGDVTEVCVHDAAAHSLDGEEHTHIRDCSDDGAQRLAELDLLVHRLHCRVELLLLGGSEVGGEDELVLALVALEDLHAEHLSGGVELLQALFVHSVGVQFAERHEAADAVVEGDDQPELLHCHDEAVRDCAHRSVSVGRNGR
mmetsp:Transcript_10891/g.44572  ORF Transcript_10891/g.44572 Transcript_10891/m.44572 type:complete len:654 (+) Transcript_10891:2552-4513(+)